jgi:hypothetical protein
MMIDGIPNRPLYFYQKGDYCISHVIILYATYYYKYVTQLMPIIHWQMIFQTYPVLAHCIPITFPRLLV